VNLFNLHQPALAVILRYLVKEGRLHALGRYNGSLGQPVTGLGHGGVNRLSRWRR
jgi:hypothetical protein